MKYFESKIYLILACFALILLLLNISACTSAEKQSDQAFEAQADMAGEVPEMSIQTVTNEQKEYPPVFNGAKIPDGDSRLRAEKEAEEIMQAIYGDSPNRVFCKAKVQGDSVKFQMVEDWNSEGKLWQFDYAQTAGDFSAITFPQIGKGDKVYEIQRDYSLRGGEIFYVREAIFARRPDGSEVLHYNKYIFEEGKLITWYRDQARYEVNERFYDIAKNLFPKINQWDFHDWINSVFKKPQEIVGEFANLQGVGPTLVDAMQNWIVQAKAMDAMIVDGEIWAGDEYSLPVIWLAFGRGRNEMGAAYVLDFAENQGNIEVYDAMDLGIAYIRPELCQSAGDVVVTLAWARKEKRLYEAQQLIHPEGLVFGSIAEIEGEAETEEESILPDALTLKNIPNLLYFGSFDGPSAFDENGFSTWKWWLPGSTETMIIQKIDSKLYWRAFEGAYH
ncbi:MAG: hypothetical protein AB8H47_27570 [Bacteroidia bacterium]